METRADARIRELILLLKCYDCLDLGIADVALFFPLLYVVRFLVTSSFFLLCVLVRKIRTIWEPCCCSRHAERT